MANIGDRLLLYLFPSFQHPGVLADPCHVFHHPLLHHYEETDQGSDHFRDQQINFGVKDLDAKFINSKDFVAILKSKIYCLLNRIVMRNTMKEIS